MNVHLLGWSIPMEDWLAYEAALLKAAGYTKPPYPEKEEEPLMWLTFGHTIPWQVCGELGDRVEEVGAKADRILKEAMAAKLSYVLRVHHKYQVDVAIRRLH